MMFDKFIGVSAVIGCLVHLLLDMVQGMAHVFHVVVV